MILVDKISLTAKNLKGEETKPYVLSFLAVVWYIAISTLVRNYKK
jgi:hypothetical protein